MTTRSTDIVYPHGSPNSFQHLTVGLIQDLLNRHGIAFEPFRLDIGAKRGFWTSIVLDGAEYLITVYPDEANVIGGPHLYECELREEFKTEEVLANSFVARLDSLLSGRGWIREVGLGSDQ